MRRALFTLHTVMQFRYEDHSLYLTFPLSLSEPIKARLCKLGGKETPVIIEHKHIHITSKQTNALSHCLLFADRFK